MCQLKIVRVFLLRFDRNDGLNFHHLFFFVMYSLCTNRIIIISIFITKSKCCSNSIKIFQSVLCVCARALFNIIMIFRKDSLRITAMHFNRISICFAPFEPLKNESEKKEDRPSVEGKIDNDDNNEIKSHIETVA